MIAGEEIRVVDEERSASAGVSRYRDDDQAGRELDGILPFDLPLDGASAARNVRAVEDALAAEPLVQRLVIGHVIAVGEEVPARPAHPFDAVEERVCRPRRIDDHVPALSHHEVAGCPEGRFGP